MSAPETVAGTEAMEATDLVAVEADRVLFRNYKRAPVAFSHGKGTRLFDLEGKEYLDFIGGIAVSSLGHAHPSLVRAVSEQAARYVHVSNLYQIPEQVEAALAAVEGGVPSAHIVGAATPHSLLLELFTRSGIGTMIHPAAVEPLALASSA